MLQYSSTNSIRNVWICLMYVLVFFIDKFTLWLEEITSKEVEIQ